MARYRTYPSGRFAGQKARNLLRKNNLLENQVEESKRDGLTGVFGRTPHTFSEIKRFLSEADRDDRAVVIAMADLDNFKTINDTFGHPVGDMVLKKAAETLVSCVRGNDLVIRWGGDEFIILYSFNVKGKNQDDIIRIPLERLKRCIASSEFTPRFSFSIGYVIMEKGETFEYALARADVEMYKIKKNR